MLNIIAITLPIYLLIGLGYGCVRGGLFSKTDMRTLGRFVVSICLPAVIFRALSQRHLAEVIEPVYMLAYAGGALLLFATAVIHFRRFRKQPLGLSALYGLGMSMPNTAFIGLPIVVSLLGEAASVPLALSMLCENLLVVTLAFALMDAGEGHTSWYRAVAGSLRGLSRNPLVLALFAGAIVGTLGMHLPPILQRSVDLLSGAASPASLFVIGGSLVGVHLGGLKRRVATFAFIKLLVHPAIVLVLLLLLPEIDPAMRTAAVLFAAMPTLSMYPVLAQRYDKEGEASATLLFATLSSFVTVGLLVWLVPMLFAALASK